MPVGQSSFTTTRGGSAAGVLTASAWAPSPTSSGSQPTSVSNRQARSTSSSSPNRTSAFGPPNRLPDPAASTTPATYLTELSIVTPARGRGGGRGWRPGAPTAAG